MIISALIIVGYTTLGGFLAASTTDFIQSIIMSIALIIVFGFEYLLQAVLTQLSATQSHCLDTLP